MDKFTAKMEHPLIVGCRRSNVRRKIEAIAEEILQSIFKQGCGSFDLTSIEIIIEGNRDVQRR